jgi:hypothetical protein
MTPEQIQRTIDFILQSQANGELQTQQFREDMTRLENSQKEQKLRIDDLLEISRRTAERNDRTEEIMKMIVEIQASQAVRLAWLEERNT